MTPIEIDPHTGAPIIKDPLSPTSGGQSFTEPPVTDSFIPPDGLTESKSDDAGMNEVEARINTDEKAVDSLNTFVPISDDPILKNYKSEQCARINSILKGTSMDSQQLDKAMKEIKSIIG